jgi:hypothetical protein
VQLVLVLLVQLDLKDRLVLVEELQVLKVLREQQDQQVLLDLLVLVQPELLELQVHKAMLVLRVQLELALQVQLDPKVQPV